MVMIVTLGRIPHELAQPSQCTSTQRLKMFLLQESQHQLIFAGEEKGQPFTDTSNDIHVFDEITVNIQKMNEHIFVQPDPRSDAAKLDKAI